MNNLLDYLKHPVYCSNQTPKVVYFLGLFFIYILAIIPISILIFFLTKEFHIKHDQLKLSTTVNTLLVVILAGPLYEEIIFRSWLKLKKINIILFFITLSFFIVKAIIDSKIATAIILTVLIFIFLIPLLSFGKIKVEKFISSKFQYFFYASSLIFGLLHATNFNGNPYLILAFMPILGGPQIILGLILGYVRMKHGLFYSILFHVLVNTLLIFTLF